MKEKILECEVLSNELDTLRNKNIERSTEIAKLRSKISDLTLSQKTCKETIQQLLQERDSLLSEVKSRMDEIKLHNDKWQQKVAEQRREINELKAEKDFIKTQQTYQSEQSI